MGDLLNLKNDDMKTGNTSKSYARITSLHSKRAKEYMILKPFQN